MAATTTHVPVEQYLNTTFRPDCDYLDGEILERNVGEWQHGKLQAILAGYFAAHRREWNLNASTEQRIRISHSRIRIPDVCVVVGPEPQEAVLTAPPFLCVELLSPGDRRSRVQERIEDFSNSASRTSGSSTPKPAAPGFTPPAPKPKSSTESCTPAISPFPLANFSISRP